MTRQEVIRAARTLFAADGYEQTTVGSIAREARVSPATVYAQCGGKEGLLRALMDLWTTSAWSRASSRTAPQRPAAAPS